MPLDLSEIANDIEIGECFSVIRTPGVFGFAGWRAGTPVKLKAWGVIAIAGPKALAQVKQGDRVEGSLQVITATFLNVTSEQNAAISDEIVWCKERYRVQNVQPWVKSGFWSAICVRMKGS